MTAINRSNSRIRVGIALLAVLAACWGWTLNGAGTGMSVWAMSTLHFPPSMELPGMALPWTPLYALAMVAMWWTMMLAMMLPGVYLQVMKYGYPDHPAALGFLSGYGAVWLCFSLAATILQYGLEQRGMLHPMRMWSLSAPLSVSLLLLAAIYQASPWKRRAQAACACFRIGDAATAQDGARYGRSCLISSAPLMSLMLVGGLMNLWWMAGLTLLVTLERVAAGAAWPRHLSAVICIAIALVALVRT